MIEILYDTNADHGRSVHVSLVKSGIGERDRFTSFTCSPVDWFDLRTAIEAGAVRVRADDYFSRLDRGLHS